MAKQPAAMLPICLTEMWERFGFYIVQTTLIFVLVHVFRLPDSEALLTLGEFGALIYFAPALGGYFADQFLGYRYTILLGCFLQLLGYLLVASLQETTVFIGLSFIILGNGFLKANLASFLGEFYKKEDDSRRAGFTYYYSIMNIGSFVGTLGAGFIQQAWGWRILFLFAVVGMAIGIIFFLLGFKRFQEKGLPKKSLLFNRPIRFALFSLLFCLIILGVSYTLIRYQVIGNAATLVVAAIVLIYLARLSTTLPSAQRANLWKLIGLIVLACFFWAIFFEMFSVVGLFVHRTVDRQLFGMEIPAVVFTSSEPVFIVLVGIFIARIWKRLETKKKSPNLYHLFIAAMICLALAMGLLSYSTTILNAHNQVYPQLILIFFFLLTLAEMIFSPSLLSAVTELSPPHRVGLMMGVQYMAIGFGNTLSGLLGQLAVIPMEVTDIHQITTIYGHAFATYANLCFAVAMLVVILLLSKKILRFVITPKKGAKHERH